MYTTKALPTTNIFFQPDNKINQQIPCRKPDELEQMRNLPLNSQRIEFIFNHYDVELVLQETDIRVSNLHSQGTMRTCAIVHYYLPIPDWLQDTHDKIFHGKSIGQTIKDDGFKLSKENVYFGITELPKIAKDKMKTDEKSAAVHIYELFVEDPETAKKAAYCSITEIHSPFYLTLGDLGVLSLNETQKYSAITESVQKYLNDINKLDELLAHSLSRTEAISV